MKKEKIKSVILFLLIINCIQLTGQIWLDKKLWPSGYNFFNSLESVPVVGNVMSMFSREASTIESVDLFDVAVHPNRIIVNGGGAREVFKDSDKNFYEVFNYTKDIMLRLLSGASQHSVISLEQWNSAIKGKSVYIDFGYIVDISAMNSIYDINISTANFNQFPKTKGMLFAPDSLTNEINVCAQDAFTGEIIKYPVEMRGDELTKYIEGLTFGRAVTHAYAFEIYLDGRTENTDTSSKSILDSMVLLPMDLISNKSIKVYNAFDNDESIVHIADKIVNAFGYAPSGLRRTVTKDGTVSYVENNATVKVNSNGLVEYDAVAANKGISVSAGSGMAARQAVIETINVAKEVWKYSGVEPYTDIRLQSDLCDNKNGRYTVKLNYFANGMPVVFNYGGSASAKASIYAEFEEGHMKSFRIMLASFESDEKQISWPLVDDAINHLFSGNTITFGTKINDIYECYSVESEGNAAAKWYVKLDENTAAVVP